MSIVLNEEANWNNKEKTVKEEYLVNYMAKNLFYLESLFNGFNAECRKFEAKNYAILLPIGYTNKMTDGSYIVNDDAWFCQAPSEY